MTIKTLKNSMNSAKKLMVYQLIAITLAGLILPSLPVKAIDPLVISNIQVTANNHTAVVTWHTNRSAYGTIRYGTSSNDYHFVLSTNIQNSTQTLTLTGLNPETYYYFQITADDQTTQIVSFEQSFKTTAETSNVAPVISDVSAVYVTGSTATIQWVTDKTSTTEIEYGRTNLYGSKATDSALTTIHDITLTGLVGNATYHYLVKSKDKYNNISKWYDVTFQTMPGNKIDNDTLIIYDVTPASNNDTNVTQSTAVISWHTNKLAKGSVNYGTSVSLGKTITSNPPRDFSQTVTLVGLKPGTIYYFVVSASDVFNKTVKSTIYSFQTKVPTAGNIPSTTPNNYTYPGTVLGAANTNINLKTDFGFWGMYYNLTSDMPGMELWHGNEVPNSLVAAENYWYDPQYFVFSRIDANINFGSRFAPVNQGKPGDPHDFAVHWRAIMEVPKTGSYTYSVTCDDDCWVYIDGQLTSNLGGVHPARTDKQTLNFTAGYHKLEIYYADRSGPSSVFSFIPDPTLKFHPLPDGYEISDILAYNNLLNSGGQQYSSGGGVVLGASNIPSPSVVAKPYVCNPDLGYTRFKALYKTTASPDIWAILETGQKHYITSPESFALYQCDWSDIKTVSQKVLDSYANANLVRGLNNPTIYHLFQRPAHQWLKINIPSPTVFVSYDGNYWGNVARINDLDIAAYPNVKLIKAGDNATVYLIDGLDKKPFASKQAFDNLHYNWAEVVELNQIHLGSYRTAQAID